jgi:hypothetical protein
MYSLKPVDPIIFTLIKSGKSETALRMMISFYSRIFDQWMDKMNEGGCHCGMPSMRKGAGLPAAPLKNSQKSKIKWERKGKRPEWFTFARYGSSKNMDGLNPHPLWSAIRTGCQQHQRWFTFPQSHHSSHRYAFIRLINANKKTALAFIFIHSYFNFCFAPIRSWITPFKMIRRPIFLLFALMIALMAFSSTNGFLFGSGGGGGGGCCCGGGGGGGGGCG